MNDRQRYLNVPDREQEKGLCECGKYYFLSDGPCCSICRICNKFKNVDTIDEDNVCDDCRPDLTVSMLVTIKLNEPNDTDDLCEDIKTTISECLLIDEQNIQITPKQDLIK